MLMLLMVLLLLLQAEGSRPIAGVIVRPLLSLGCHMERTPSFHSRVSPFLQLIVLSPVTRTWSLVPDMSIHNRRLEKETRNLLHVRPAL